MKLPEKFEITVVSSPEYEMCVAEIWYDNEVFAIVSNDEFERVEVIARGSGDWDFQYGELMSVLNKAIELVRMNERPTDENDT